MSWTSEQARTLADRILSFSKAAECEVSLRQSQTGHTRFAANEITTAGMVRNVSVSITSREGGKSGSTTTDELDDSLLREAVARSEALMAAARPDPEQVESLDPQQYPPIPAFDDATAAAGPIERRDGVKAALDLARKHGLNASGFFETGARWLAIANKKGNFGFHRATVAEYSTTMRTADGTGSGYARLGSTRLADLDPLALAERAAKKAQTSANPHELAPGTYTVILEPEAVADLLRFLLFSLNARSADEGRSFLSKPGGGTRLGEKLFADGVTLRSDPFNPRQPGTPWAAGMGRGGRGARRAAGPQDHLDRERRRENTRRRPLLGQENQGRARPALRRPDPGRLGQVARSPDRRDPARPAGDAVLVHSFGQPPDGHGHRPHPRRRLADRRRQGRSPGQQLPVQRRPGQSA